MCQQQWQTSRCENKEHRCGILAWHDVPTIHWGSDQFVKEMGTPVKSTFPLHVENDSEDAEFICMQVQESRPPTHQDNGWDSSVSSDTWTLPVVAVAMQQTNSGLFGCCFETMVTLRWYAKGKKQKSGLPFTSPIVLALNRNNRSILYSWKKETIHGWNI